MTLAERDRKVDELRAIESRLRYLGEYYCAAQVRRSISLAHIAYGLQARVAALPVDGAENGEAAA